jgi:hypothetical protein
MQYQDKPSQYQAKTKPRQPQAKTSPSRLDRFDDNPSFSFIPTIVAFNFFSLAVIIGRMLLCHVKAFAYMYLKAAFKAAHAG